MRKLPSGRAATPRGLLIAAAVAGPRRPSSRPDHCQQQSNDPARGRDVPDSVVEAIREEITAVGGGRGAVHEVDLSRRRRPTIPGESAASPVPAISRRSAPGPTFRTPAAPRLGPHKASVGCGEKCCADDRSAPPSPERPPPWCLRRHSPPGSRSCRGLLGWRPWETRAVRTQAPSRRLRDVALIALPSSTLRRHATPSRAIATHRPGSVHNLAVEDSAPFGLYCGDDGGRETWSLRSTRSAGLRGDLDRDADPRRRQVFLQAAAVEVFAELGFESASSATLSSTCRRIASSSSVATQRGTNTRSTAYGPCRNQNGLGVIVWHSEALPFPRTSGLGLAPMTPREIAKVILRDRHVSDPHSNARHCAASPGRGLSIS